VGDTMVENVTRVAGSTRASHSRVHARVHSREKEGAGADANASLPRRDRLDKPVAALR